jgi:hypothetical protein
MNTVLTVLETQIKEGWVKRRKHPEFPLWIYNYTHATQYARNWNDTTTRCRGLILDEYGTVVANPFRKFFNYTELEGLGIELPDDHYSIFNKLDGCLFIMVMWRGHLIKSTRGSFDNEYITEANVVLEEKYPDLTIREDFTYCYEFLTPTLKKGGMTCITYPESDLRLLAVRDTFTGREIGLHAVTTCIPRTELYEHDCDVSELYNVPNQENKEGFVLAYDNGFRVKVKFDWYVRHHRILQLCNDKTVWKYLSDPELDIQELIDIVPDEYYKWLHTSIDNFRENYVILANTACKQYMHLITSFPESIDMKKRTSKAVAEKVINIGNKQIISLVFTMLQGKNIKPLIWKYLKPKQTEKK